MAVKEYVMIGSALIVVIGWFVNSHFNRKHEIAKRKLEYRLDALKSYLPVAFDLTSAAPLSDETDFFNKLKTANTNFQLYGTEEEIKLMDNFVYAYQKKDHEGMKKAHLSLYDCVRKQLRNELDIN